LEIIGLTKFLPTKFCFDQRFLPSVSGGEFEMATGREEEEEEAGEDFDDNFGTIMRFFLAREGFRCLIGNILTGGIEQNSATAEMKKSWCTLLVMKSHSPASRKKLCLLVATYCLSWP